MRSASARAALAALAVASLTAAVPAEAETPGWHGGTFTTASNELVTVHVSSSYPPDEVVPRDWAEFFAALPHGPELASVVVRIAPPAEVASLCGDDAVGCYWARELVMPGEPYAGTPPEEVARHEYGHHVAANRSNAPWNAVAWGPKRWATATGICRRSQERTAFPGGHGEHYRLNPGEAFAEAYRVLVERKAGVSLGAWGLVDDSFYPDQAALRAVEHDVLAPWVRPTTKRHQARFRQGGPRRWLLPVATPLDGELTAELRLPHGRLDRLELLAADGRVLARGLWSGTNTLRLGYLVCGQRKLTLRVTSDGTAGRFDLTLSRP